MTGDARFGSVEELGIGFVAYRLGRLPHGEDERINLSKQPIYWVELL